MHDLWSNARNKKYFVHTPYGHIIYFAQMFWATFAILSQFIIEIKHKLWVYSLILSIIHDSFPGSGHLPQLHIENFPRTIPCFSCFFNKIDNLTISFSCSLHPALQGYSGPPYPFSLLFPQTPYASSFIHIFPHPVPKRYNAKKDRNSHKRVPAL